MYSKNRNFPVNRSQITKFTNLFANKIRILLLPVVLAVFILYLTPARVILIETVLLLLLIINFLLADLFYILGTVASLFIFFYYKIKFEIIKNGIIYEFHRFRWKSKLVYIISQEEFVLTSINKIFDDIPKLILYADVTFLDNIMTLKLELEFQQSIIPMRSNKIENLLSKSEFLSKKKLEQNISKNQVGNSRYVSLVELIDKNMFDIAIVNSKILDCLTAESKNFSNFSIKYKMKKISSSLISTNLSNLDNTNNTKNISNHQIPPNENHQMFLLSLQLSLPRKNQFEFLSQKLSDQTENFKINKKEYLHLISLSSLNQLNYSIINKIRSASQLVISEKMQLNHKDQTLENSCITIANDENHKDFSINLSDLNQGGIIAGAIGSGKTTLRLTLIEKLIQQGKSILDIDYKGDAPRLFRFQNKGLVLIPGKNLHLDIFDKPDNISTIEFIGMLFRSFVESIQGGELTPPQKHILHEALRKTVMKRGNIEAFFRNIIIASMESKEIIENYQQQTALALINKYNWLQTTMRNVFGVQGQSISGEDLAINNIFIDLSYIQHSAPNNHVRFFLDILITKLMLYYKSVESDNFNKLEMPLRKIIFLDETHMIMPNKNTGSLTKLEELVVTLRHKGLSVIATTTNPALISNIFLDAGFVAQFRTESKIMHSSLGFANSQINSLSQLPNFKFYLKSNSTNYSLELLKTKQFFDNSLTTSEYYESIIKYDVGYLNEFRIENGDFQAALLESIIFHSLPIEPYRKIIYPISKTYVRKYSSKLDRINSEESFRRVLLSAFSDYIDDDEGIPELKVHFYVKCFLYQFIILYFKFIFVQISLGVNMKKGHIKDFKYQYKGLFLDLIIYIDELLSNYFKDESLEI